MSVSERIPYDFLSNTGYRFWVKRLPNASFSVQKVRLPGLSLPAVFQATPFVNVPKAGDHIAFNELSVEFIVDEKLKNYMDIWTWIKGLGFPSSFRQYQEIVKEPGTGVASELLLSILDAKKQPKLEITFHQAIPIALSDLVFDATTSDLIYLSVEAKFAYVNFSIHSD